MASHYQSLPADLDRPRKRKRDSPQRSRPPCCISKRRKSPHYIDSEEIIKNWLEDTQSQQLTQADNGAPSTGLRRRSHTDPCSKPVQGQPVGSGLNSPNRKRRLDPGKLQQDHPRIKRVRLTRDNVQKHSKIQEGAPSMGKHGRKAPSQTGTSTSQTESQSFTTSSNGYDAQLLMNGIVHSRTKVRQPEDADDIKTYLAQSRRSPSPEEDNWREYLDILDAGSNERTLQHNAWNEIHKRPRGGGYRSDYDLAWTEVEDSHLTFRLKPAKPDMTESFRWNEYPQKVLLDLGPALCPTAHKPAMPIFAVEAKSVEKGTAAAETQCAYDGALMVDAAKVVHKYLGKDLSLFYGQTKALSIAYNGDGLMVFAHHAVRKADGGDSPSTEHHSYGVFSARPVHSLEEFKAAYRATRNAQQWCRERAVATLEDLQRFARETLASTAVLMSPPPTTSSGPAPADGDGWTWSAIENDHYRITSTGAYEWSSMVSNREADVRKIRRL